MDMQVIIGRGVSGGGGGGTLVEDHRPPGFKIQ